MSRSRFDILKKGNEANFCGEIDWTKEDVYSIPWDPISGGLNMFYNDFNISNHFYENYYSEFEDMMDYLEVFEEFDEHVPHMGDLQRALFYQINDLWSDPTKWSNT